MSCDVDGKLKGIWMRVRGDNARVTPEVGRANATWRSKNWGIQVGTDIIAAESKTSYWLLGITGQHDRVMVTMERIWTCRAR
ncbi:MAG TPA: autotransporter outer membrane beta-barrel domain-containing protein [Nitrosomonas sp.]|nr:autotransporter outer membrane beta-barrel domain-containing protein [Nitrosomonas sp.]